MRSVGLLMVLWCTMLAAQSPVARLDINMEGRRESEVNTSGYTPWYISRVRAADISVEGVSFTLTAVAPGNEATMRTSWSKALVQQPYYMTLVNDGVTVDNDMLLANPGQGGVLELEISGLPVGKHALQTYHNLWSDSSKINRAPINVYLNNQLVHARVVRSQKVTSVSEATVLYTVLEVTSPGQRMTLRMEPDMNYTGNPTKATDYNVCINAIELNTTDTKKQAREPLPADRDFHADADDQTIQLSWLPAISNTTALQFVYVGTDSVAVFHAEGTNDPLLKAELPADSSTLLLDNLYSMQTYYWRVDQLDTSGIRTKGKVWQFKPRQLAFPGAEGYGRFARGGRGGQVVYVTNLKDAGEGSFRHAVENYTGPRTILFRVSGLITLNSRLVINHDQITVAGQTAPGKGICFRWAPLGIVGDDLIIQNLRVRLGIGVTYDGMGLTGANHSIIDHCSISWTIDEAFSSRGAKNITLQNTLISEALNQAGHSNYPEGKRHGFAASIGGDVGSFHHNLLAHCAGRNWSMAGGLDGDGYYSGRLDITNNVVYNWEGRTTDGGAHEVNFVNNYYKKGAASKQNNMLIAQLEGTGKGSQSYFYKGNVREETNGSLSCNGLTDACGRDYQKASNQVLDWELWVNEPFFPSYVNTQTAEEAYKIVVSTAGCTQPAFDEHDQRMVHETLTGTYSVRGSKSNLPGLPDHEKDVDAWETYPGYERADNWDSDNDGLPDWWENALGLNPNSSPGDFTEANADPDKDGYTRLEDYLQWMAQPHYFMEEQALITVNMGDYTRGFTKKPVYSILSSVNGTAKLVPETFTFEFSPEQKGFAQVTFRVEDEEGSALTRTVQLFVGETPADLPFEYSYFLERSKSTLITVNPATAVPDAPRQNKVNTVRLYPNPARSTVVVSVHKGMSEPSVVTLSHINGQVLQRTTLPAGQTQLQLPTNQLKPGMYYISLQNASVHQTIKFIRRE